MVSSAATTVEGYLASLPAERRAVVSTVRDLVLQHLPDGYREWMAWGMIGYGIPLERYPDTYNGQPLCYVALAAQKIYYALYLTCAADDEGDAQRLKDAFARAGKTLDMGKSCLRFKSLDALPLAAIGDEQDIDCEAVLREDACYPQAPVAVDECRSSSPSCCPSSRP
jgi:hypothetical protein